MLDDGLISPLPPSQGPFSPPSGGPLAPAASTAYVDDLTSVGDCDDALQATQVADRMLDIVYEHVTSRGLD